jgi:putative hydrolase of the HAD superfamily
MTPRKPATEAVLLDALGTLIELEPPWIHLRESVPPGIPDERLVAAVRAEMAYYKQHAAEGRDRESLADLRRRCAEVLSRELRAEVSPEALVAAIRLRPYPDVAEALEALAGRGVKRIVVSNWDCSLGEVLERCGLAARLDGWVSSAEAGASKPDPAIFERALELAGCAPAAALHVGDTPEEDAKGAAAAGIRSLIVDREDRGGISSLAEVVEHL